MNAKTAAMAVALLVLLAGSVLAAPDSLTKDSGDLYLRTDNTLAAEPGSPATTCLTLSGTGPATSTATFTTTLVNGSYYPTGAEILLSLAVAPNGQAGTGFTVHADAALGNGSTASADKSYGAGASIDSPITLVLPLENKTGQGEVSLTVTLAKAGANGLPGLTQNVQVQCNAQDSRLHSFQYAIGQPGDLDQDGNGVPDGSDDGGHGGSLSKTNVMLVALGAGIVTLIAGLLVIAGKAVGEKALHALLGGTAGLLIAVALVDLVPEALEGNPSSGWTIALGILALSAIGWIAGHSHGHGDAGHGEHGHEHHDDHDGHKHEVVKNGELPHSSRFVAVAFFALLFHRIVDGLALPGAFAAGDIVGFAASSAVLIHQFPDGIAAASVLLAGRLPRRKILYGVIILSFATPLGALAGLGIANIDGILPHLLGLAAATFIFIALSELLPELRRPQYRWQVAIGFVVGYAIAYGIQLVAAAVGIEV